MHCRVCLLFLALLTLGEASSMPAADRPSAQAQDQQLWLSPEADFSLGVLKPAAETLHAVQWAIPDESGGEPKGWRSVKLTGWLVARSKSGRELVLHDTSGWHVGPQDKEDFINMHASTTLDRDKVVATLHEGSPVSVTQQLKADGKDWIQCTLTAWVLEGLAAEKAFKATLTFPHPEHAATVSTRVFWMQGAGKPVTMSFINRREDSETEKKGRVLLQGQWQGRAFTSSTQKVLGKYEGWVDETISLKMEPDFSSGTVTTNFPRKQGKVTAQVKATAPLHLITPGADAPVETR